MGIFNTRFSPINSYGVDMNTHERFIQAVRQAALETAAPILTSEQRERLAAIKLLYGVFPGVRGVTFFGAWKGPQPEVIEISAMGEESWVQLAGTTVHELAHALSGHQAGHGAGWKENCRKLGLRLPKAAGMDYKLAYFTPELRDRIARLPHPEDGKPDFLTGINLPRSSARPCSAGVGTRGGKSRGPGSGSRLRKFVCECTPPIIIRASRDELPCTCNLCGSQFKRGD